MLHQVEEQPHVRSQVIVVDIAVNWKGNVPLNQSYNKRLIYDNPSFREAAERPGLKRPMLPKPSSSGLAGYDAVQCADGGRS